MEYRAAGSLRFDVGRPDHLAPFFGFVRDELTEVGRRSRERRATQVAKASPHLGISKSGVDLPVKLVDGLGWRPRRYAQTCPEACLKTGQEIADWRNVGQGVRASGSCYSEC